METIAVFGAGGKMGCRIADNLRRTEYPVHYVEVSPAGVQRLRDRGLQVTTQDEAVAALFDNTPAKRDLGFEYRTRFLDGMRDTLRWVDERHGFENSDEDHLYDRVIDAWKRAGDKLTVALAPRELGASVG